MSEQTLMGQAGYVIFPDGTTLEIGGWTFSVHPKPRIEALPLTVEILEEEQ